jgi:hypothetical protein
MTRKYPRTQSIATNESQATTAWPDARDQLAAADRYWLATVRADGRPHVMPLRRLVGRHDVLHGRAQHAEGC